MRNLLFLVAFLFTGAISYAQPNEEMIYDYPEQMPEFPGGGDALDQFLKENLKYPEEAKNKQIQGKVYVGFVVEKDGSVTNIQIRKSAHPLLDAEAMRVVKLMPKWKPGSMRGKTVRTRYTLPVIFSLTS